MPELQFRASIIIGSGSLSFEMIRSLVERLPVIITFIFFLEVTRFFMQIEFLHEPEL